MKKQIVTILSASAALAVILSLTSCSKLEKPKTWYCDVYATSTIGGQTGYGHQSFTIYGTKSDMENAVAKAKASTTYAGTVTNISCH